MVRGKVYIVDDVFPHPRAIDSWRGIEFLEYLDYFFESKIYTSMKSIALLGEQLPADIIKEFYDHYPQYENRVIWYKDNLTSDAENAELFYFIFLNNAWNNIEFLEKNNIPFVFELYPGGGFALNNDESDRKLLRLVKSDCFKGVIVSSKVTYNYLKDKQLCCEKNILFVPGCILNNDSWSENTLKKKYYGIDKKQFDIGFVAYCYSAIGAEKGYDVFIDIAKKLHRISEDFHFHVVGNFNESIIDISGLESNIHFYGIQNTDWFNQFYSYIDVLLSPTVSFRSNPGTFDGFPTGCGMDALVRKTVLITTDDLQQNNGQYENGKDLYIVENSDDIIISRILYLYKYPEELKRMGSFGCEKAKQLYSFEKQIYPRIKYLEEKL